MTFPMLATILVGLTISLGRAQELTPPPAPTPVLPPILENTGKPVVVPFQCSAEDIQAAGLSCSEDDPCPIYLELTAV